MPSIPVFCGKDCGGGACPLLAIIENERVERVINNPAGGKYLKGCQRGYNLPLELYADDRILKPLIRTGERGSGQFRQASWEEALTLTSQKLVDIRTKYSANSILCLASSATTGALHATDPLLSRFLNLFGGCTKLSSTYSNAAARFVLPYMLGNQWTQSGFDAATMQYAEMIILWGANVLEARLGSEIPQRLVEAKRRGAQIIVIDPRCSPTVKQTANWWIPCRPGSDTAMMLAVLHVMISEKLVNRAFINAHSVGFEQLESYVLGKDGNTAHNPQWAESLCGVPAEEIARFARAYAASKPAMLLPGYSIQRVFAGEDSFRLTVALQIATGNFGQRGGSTGSLNNRLPTPQVGSMEVPDIPEQPTLPILRWPDAVLQGQRGGYPSDIHAIYSVGGNFINQGCDIHKNIAAFNKADFTVCHEVFLTPTARFCDIILPAATPLEKEDIGIPWLGNYLLYKPQAVSPRGEARCDYDIFCDLAEHLGFFTQYSANRSKEEWVQYFLDQSEVVDHDMFRSTGIYLAPDQERVGLSDFTTDPIRHPLSTLSGLVEIASKAYQQQTGYPAIPTWQPAPQDKRFPLSLITPKSIHRTHSQGSNIPQIQRKAAHTLEMNPQDALTRGIQDGDKVRLFNTIGTAHVTVRLSDDLGTGVVCLPEGVWVEFDEEGVDVAGSANMFTTTGGTSPGTACIMHAVGVEVAGLNPAKKE